MTAHFREARIEDASFLCQAEQYWAAIPGHLVSQPAELSPDAFKKTITSLAGSSTGLYLVAEVDARIVGHLLIEPMSLVALRHVGRLTIVIHANETDKGYGRLLLAEALRQVREAGALRRIELQVRCTNERALALYRKFGFTEEGRLRKRIRLPDGEFLDDVMMGQFL